MYVILRYPDARLRVPPSGFETADEEGMASVDFVVRGGTAGRTVYVDVYFDHEGQVHRKTTLARCELSSSPVKVRRFSPNTRSGNRRALVSSCASKKV